MKVQWQVSRSATRTKSDPLGCGPQVTSQQGAEFLADTVRTVSIGRSLGVATTRNTDSPVTVLCEVSRTYQ